MKRYRRWKQRRDSFGGPQPFRQGRHDPGGGLVVDEGDGVILAGGQGPVDQFRGDRLAPFHFDGIGFLAAAAGHVVPLVGEGAVAEIGAARSPPGCAPPLP